MRPRQWIPVLFGVGVVALFVMALVRPAWFGMKERMSNLGDGDIGTRAGGAKQASDTNGAPWSAGGETSGGKAGELSPNELLPPAGAAQEWASVNPTGAGDLRGQNFLTTGGLVGVNSIGPAKRNQTFDIRGEPPNPRVSVGPWLQSSLDAPEAFSRGIQGEPGLPLLDASACSGKRQCFDY